MHSSTADPTKLFLGSIQFPEPLQYDLSLYYKGQKLVTEWDSDESSTQFSFLESKYTQELYILICETISYKTTEKNTIKHLIVTSNKYKCYQLIAQRSQTEQGTTECSWQIKEHKLDSMVIPDNTLIFLFNPDFISGLQGQSWKSDNTMRLMPIIEIDPTIETKDLNRTMTITRLTAIDIDSLHSKINKKHPL